MVEIARELLVNQSFIHDTHILVFRVSLFVYFKTRKYIKKGFAKYTSTRKYIEKGLSENKRYTIYRKIGFIRIHDDTRKFR